MSEPAPPHWVVKGFLHRYLSGITRDAARRESNAVTHVLEGGVRGGARPRLLQELLPAKLRLLRLLLYGICILRERKKIFKILY